MPRVISLLTPFIVRGRFDETVELADEYVEEGHALGIIKAFSILMGTVIERYIAEPDREEALKKAGLSWTRNADIFDGEEIADQAMMRILAELECDCGHESFQHKLGWMFWEVGQASGGSCKEEACGCEEFMVEGVKNFRLGADEPDLD